ncbi:MAG: hypothetical protein WC277_10430 [Bacilli bacterium]
MWFVYDADAGFYRFPTEEQAAKYYDARFAWYHEESCDEEEWHPNVTTLCIGEIRAVTKLQKMNIESDDDDLEDIRPVFYEAVTTVVG